MERDSKRNSILKMVNLTTTVSVEEESREVYRFQQKSFKKRVSFAGRDEIKEFKKNETLINQPSVAILANNLLCNSEQIYGVEVLLETQSSEFSTHGLQDTTIQTKKQSFPESHEGKEEVVTAVFPRNEVVKSNTLQAEEEIENQKVILYDFASSNILNDFNNSLWKLSFIGHRMTLKCENMFLKISFKLGKHFCYDGGKHFKIDDMDVDISQAESTAKWVRFGSALLENSLESMFKKLPDPSTLDLKRFLEDAEQIYDSFSEFLSVDVVGIELLVDPRSLILDIELYKISFDMSNLENLKMIHVDLFLRGVYPLSFTEVKLVNKIGAININEATTMLMNTRSSRSFLTKVAQCLSDLLKFKSCI